jgi:hypothetical protein
MFFKAIDATTCGISLLFGLDLVGRLVIHIPLSFVGTLVPKGIGSPLLQTILVGLEVVLIVAPLIVAALLSSELSEEAE